MIAKDAIRVCALLGLVASAQAQTPQDRAAQALGLTNFAHYQRNLNACANLVRGYLNSREPKIWAHLHRFEWSEYKCAAIAAANRASRPGTVSYAIEVAHNDELFIINGEKFEAQAYCMGWEEGDQVLFLDGSPLGACASAELLNLRTKEKCNVWCE